MKLVYIKILYVLFAVKILICNAYSDLSSSGISKSTPSSFYEEELQSDLRSRSLDLNFKSDNSNVNLGLFPRLDISTSLTVNTLINEYPFLMFDDKYVSIEELGESIKYYKVNMPVIFDSLGELGNQDPRTERGVGSKFTLYVSNDHTRVNRIKKYLLSYIGLDKVPQKDLIEITLSLFSVSTYNECRIVVVSYSEYFIPSEFCKSLIQNDLLSILPEDFPKNILKEKDELYPLTGTVLSLPMSLLTSFSDLTWRYQVTDDGTFHAYNSGSLDGFAHMSFLAKKLHDMTKLLYTENYQYLDDVRAEIFHILSNVQTISNSKGVNKMLELEKKIMYFYLYWFKGSKRNKCSELFANVHKMMKPIYDSIQSILGLIVNDENTVKKMVKNPRMIIIHIILPMFISIQNQFNSKVVNLGIKKLRYLTILEEIDFNVGKIEESLQKFQRCYKGFNKRTFNYRLKSIKRVIYSFLKLSEKNGSDYVPYPSKSSPLFIKGFKFGIKNMFKKDRARKKQGYYRQISPLKNIIKENK